MTANISGLLVGAFERTWDIIRNRHGDVPPVVITIGSGTLGTKSGQVRLGHFAAARWQHGDTQQLAELFISGEGLCRGAVDVFGTLLHEATHGVANTREIKDTSRQGRYHNRRFRDLGTELGLTLEEDSRIGWSVTRVPPATVEGYTDAIGSLTDALVAYRHAEVKVTKTTKSTNLVVAACFCPRKIRVAASTLGEAPIVCGACRHEFFAEEADE